MTGDEVIRSSTVTVLDDLADAVPLVLRLRSHPPLQSAFTADNPTATERPHVTFAPGTIDNEHLGRLKSNCCCIYVKPRVFDDPSTWVRDEFETEHCRGHTLPPPPPKKDDESKEIQ